MIALGLVVWLAAATTADPPVRTLDAVTIEGQVTAPRVLFITSHDRPRHREDLGRRYRRTPGEILRGARRPCGVVIRHDCVLAATKEP